MGKVIKIYKMDTFEELGEVSSMHKAAKIIGTSAASLTQNTPYQGIRFSFSKGCYVVDMLQPQAVALLKIEKIKAMFDNPDKWYFAKKAIEVAWKELESI
jgi:hypothetical protein